MERRKVSQKCSGHGTIISSQGRLITISRDGMGTRPCMFPHCLHGPARWNRICFLMRRGATFQATATQYFLLYSRVFVSGTTLQQHGKNMCAKENMTQIFCKSMSVPPSPAWMSSVEQDMFLDATGRKFSSHGNPLCFVVFPCFCLWYHISTTLNKHVRQGLQ